MIIVATYSVVFIALEIDEKIEFFFKIVQRNQQRNKY